MTPEQANLDKTLDTAPQVREMLSTYGRRVYFASGGVLGQTWEAREKAYTFNATLGEAKTQGHTISSKRLMDTLSAFSTEEIFPYAKPAGLPELRALWVEKVRQQNPLLAKCAISMPVVTCGLTHALSLTAELFLDEGDDVIVHDQHWENYEMIFHEHFGAHISNYATFANDQFNVAGLSDALDNMKAAKALVVLNFPNNPT